MRARTTPKIFDGKSGPLTEAQAGAAAMQHHRALNWMPFPATGAGLKMYRESVLRWTQGAMAAALGLSLRSYVELEAGRRNVRRRLVLAVWAIVLLETGKVDLPGGKGAANG